VANGRFHRARRGFGRIDAGLGRGQGAPAPPARPNGSLRSLHARPPARSDLRRPSIRVAIVPAAPPPSPPSPRRPPPVAAFGARDLASVPLWGAAGWGLGFASSGRAVKWGEGGGDPWYGARLRARYGARVGLGCAVGALFVSLSQARMRLTGFLPSD